MKRRRQYRPAAPQAKITSTRGYQAPMTLIESFFGTLTVPCFLM